MHRIKLATIALTMAAALCLIAGQASNAGNLNGKSCSQLIRMAQNMQQDIKTVDMVLGSAIDAGSLDRIKSYKLQKNASRKTLDSILKAIQARDCVLD